MPATECLADVVARMLPYWEPRSSRTCGRQTVLLAAHGNSLRALVKHLDGIRDEDIAGLNIPTGIPLVYQLDDDLAARPRRRVPRPGPPPGRRGGRQPGTLRLSAAGRRQRVVDPLLGGGQGVVR